MTVKTLDLSQMQYNTQLYKVDIAWTD